MPADIYAPELWSSFFTMVGSGAAALTGLVFVAVSLNLEGMTKDPTHKHRSINTLSGLTAVFVRCGLVLMGGQSHTAVGMELLTIASIGVVIFLFGFHQAFKFGGHPSTLRLAVGSCLYFAEIVGAAVLVSGSILGLYVAAVAMVINVGFMTSAAWLLVVGVYGDRMRE